ncbi:MAG: outer membrane beta-barrel protein [Bryobacteraceae bacterium]
MRSLFVFPLMAIAALAQPVSFGVRAGVPLTDLLNASSALPQPGSPPSRPFTSTTNRYLIGPTIEVRLPLGLSLGFDALYRHYDFSSPGFVTAPPAIYIMQGAERAEGGDWEFPLMAKYHFSSKLVRPYVGAGVASDRLGGSSAIICAINCGTSSTPPELRHDTVTGFVAGVGIDIHVPALHLSPEIRYTRWGAQHFVSSSGVLSSNQNQAEFLLGITF